MTALEAAVALTDMLDERDSLNRILDRVEQVVIAEVADNDVETLAALYDHLDTVRQRITRMHAETGRALAEVMPKTLELEGLPVMERRTGTTRKAWQSEDLLSHLVRDAIDPDHTGELPAPAEVMQAVTAVVLETMPVTPSMGWRVTALRARGVDPDEWCETRPGATTVQIHRPTPTPDTRKAS